MSLAFKQLDQDIINSLSEEAENLLKEIFGVDISIHYGLDGQADLRIVGGDIALAGTSVGNTVAELEELVRSRVMTRLLVYYSESPLLPAGYGSFITDVIGVTIVDGLDVDITGNNIHIDDIQAFIRGIIYYSLQDEPFVTQVNDITIETDNDGTLSVAINFSSAFLKDLSASLVLSGD